MIYFQKQEREKKEHFKNTRAKNTFPKNMFNPKMFYVKVPLSDWWHNHTDIAQSFASLGVNVLDNLLATICR